MASIKLSTPFMVHDHYYDFWGYFLDYSQSFDMPLFGECKPIILSFTIEVFAFKDTVH